MTPTSAIEIQQIEVSLETTTIVRHFKIVIENKPHLSDIYTYI